MNFEYMVAFLSGNEGEAMQIAVNQLCQLEVMERRQYTTGQVEN
jgi:hypothetical protein